MIQLARWVGLLEECGRGKEPFFQSEHGAAQYQQCQNLINEGIQDGKDVIMRHGDVIDRSSNSFEATDFSVGNNFGSV